MTEAEWRKATDCRQLLVLLERHASGRKARLFACGLGRLLWPYLGDDRSRTVIEVAERKADGEADSAELIAAHDAAADVIRGTASRVAYWVGDHHPWQSARVVAMQIQGGNDQRDATDWGFRFSRIAPEILRCVFRFPFRPVAFDPGWQTVDALGLARGIYKDRDFGRMPLLADALMDAGCDDDQIISHCRTGGLHVRGCWVVDLVLGKQ
jgi:hypothetical protein